MKNKLTDIPGIGTALSRDLLSIGIKNTDSLIGKDPEKLYNKLSSLHGKHIDRCVLYAFRCAVYYASDGKEKRLLKWWNWKD
ncbi:MAG TPA: helix-hairpin-helix domain-containing protein [archaeon]|nr:helix-hairpin-helix domain-containing protein [archaeon]